MRPFVSDFLLPIVRGGPAHVGRPLGLRAIARFMRDLPLNDDRVIADLSACRLAIATRVSPVATPPPLDESSMRLGAALHDLLALGHPEVGGPRSRRADRVAAAALELASIGAPRSAAGGREPALVAGAAAGNRTRRPHGAVTGSDGRRTWGVDRRPA